MKHASRLARVMSLTAGGALATATAVAVTPAADASGDGAYNIQTLQGDAVSVGSTGCRDVRVDLTYVNPVDSDYTFDADLEVWHNGVDRDTTHVAATGSLSQDATVAASGTYSYCPATIGLGRVRLGPSQVTGHSVSGDTPDRSFEDHTRGQFLAKRATHTTLALSRSRTARRDLRFTSTVSAYLVGRHGYARWPHKYVHIQRRNASGWSDVTVLRTNRRGVATGAVYAPHRRQWRALIVGTPLAWGSISHAHTSPPVPPPPPPPPGPRDSSVHITRVQYDSPGSDGGSNASLNAEWVRITNRAHRGKKLTGWRLSDPTGHVYRFPKFTLPGGASVRVHTGHGTNTHANLYWRQDWYVWNNTGDRATLRNPNRKVIDRCSWGDGPGATTC